MLTRTTSKEKRHPAWSLHPDEEGLAGLNFVYVKVLPILRDNFKEEKDSFFKHLKIQPNKENKGNVFALKLCKVIIGVSPHNY